MRYNTKKCLHNVLNNFLTSQYSLIIRVFNNNKSENEETYHIFPTYTALVTVPVWTCHKYVSVLYVKYNSKEII